LTVLGNSFSSELGNLNAFLYQLANPTINLTISGNDTTSIINNIAFQPNSSVNLSTINTISQSLIKYAEAVQDVPQIHNKNNTQMVNNVLSKF
jgi:hypothetical protein